VKFHPAYIAYLPKAAAALAAEIKKLEEGQPSAAGPTDKEKTNKRIEQLKKQLAQVAADQQKYTRENYEKLSAREKASTKKHSAPIQKIPIITSLPPLLIRTEIPNGK